MTQQTTLFSTLSSDGEGRREQGFGGSVCRLHPFNADLSWRMLIIVNLNGYLTLTNTSPKKGGWDLIFDPFTVLTNGSTLV